MRINDLLKNKFLRSSGIVLIGAVIVNFFNYFFNLVLGRMLTPEEYGAAAVLTTLVFIVSVPSTTLTTFIAKYIAEYRAKNNAQSSNLLYKQVTRYGIIVGVVGLVALWLLNPLLIKFINVDKTILSIFWILFPITLFASASKGVLQGFEDFNRFTISNLIGTVSKIMLAVILLSIHLSVLGVVLSLILSGVVVYFYNIYSVSKHLPLPSNSDHAPLFQTTSSYLMLVFWFTLLWSVFGNVDVIFAKKFLTDFDAGQYAALAVMGRIVTYSSLAVVAVLFPMAAHSKASGSNTGRKYLVLSLSTVGVISAVILLFFYSLPNFTVSLLFSSKYLPIARYLWLIGLSMMFGALGAVLANYLMAIHNKKFIYPFAFSTILQVIALSLYHKSILMIVWDLLVTSFIFFVTMIYVYLRAHSVTNIDEQLVEGAQVNN